MKSLIIIMINRYKFKFLRDKNHLKNTGYDNHFIKNI